MLCPYQGDRKWPCGQCMPCRINRQRAWAGRILLESHFSDLPGAIFVTLTYAPEFLPMVTVWDDKDGNALEDPYEIGDLFPADLESFVRGLRNAIRPRKMRYFAVGEYGGKFKRPHYHLMIWGVTPFEKNLIAEVWAKGRIDVGNVSPHSAMYVGQYCTKRMTTKDSPELLGRHPEFSRMSRKPYIGAGAVPHLLKMYRSEPGRLGLELKGDIAEEYRFEGKMWPMARIMKEDLRQALNIPVLARDRPEPLRPEVTTEDMNNLLRRDERFLRKVREDAKAQNRFEQGATFIDFDACAPPTPHSLAST